MVWYYLVGAACGMIGSFAGLLVDTPRKIKPKQVAVYLVCGSVLGLFVTMIMADTWGTSPVLLGIIGLASFKAVDVLAGLSVIATTVIKRLRGGNDEP